MKTIIISIFAIGLLIFSLFSFSKSENNGHNGKCTGSSYCTACSNCSRCGHCSSGGTCGVCSGSSSGRAGSSSYKKKKHNYPKSNIGNHTSLGLYSRPKKKVPIYHYETKTSLTEENFLYIIYKTANIRSGAGKDFPIIETVKKNSKLILLFEKSNWYKVRVYDSGNEGYIYNESVR